MSWNTYIVGAGTKYRPWDITPTDTSLTLNVVKGQWACFQVACKVSAEDVVGVNVAVTTPVKGGDSLNAPIIYKEIPYNVILKSRDDGATGEWVDALVPKVDPFFSEARNVFPFNINRVSSSWSTAGSPITYVKFDITAIGDVIRRNGATIKPTIGGTYSGSGQLNYHVKIDLAGAKEVATFKWSDDGGSTWDATGVLTGDTIALNNGLTITFEVQNYTLNDEWEFFANTSRTEMVWVDIFVPTTAVAGTYTSTITVSATDKANQTLDLSIVVYNLAIPLTSSIPIYITASRDGIAQGHYAAFQSNTYNPLYQDYLESALNHRISLQLLHPMLHWTSPNITDWSTYETWIAPYANGSWSMGSALSVMNIPSPEGANHKYYCLLIGATVKESNLTSDEAVYLATLKVETDANGWTSKYYNLIAEEPSVPPTGAQITAMTNVSGAIHSISSLFKQVTIKQYQTDWAGGITDVWNPNLLYIPDRSVYNDEIAAGRQLWTNLTCMSKGCDATGGPSFNKWPSHMVDAALPNLRGYYWLMFDNDVAGDLYYAIAQSYTGYLDHGAEEDMWDTIFKFGGDGDGTLYYAGRPNKIGGTNHIPIETIRLKTLRMGLEDYEIFKQADAVYTRAQIETVTAIGTNKYFYTTPVDYDTMGTQMEAVRNSILNSLLGASSSLSPSISPSISPSVSMSPSISPSISPSVSPSLSPSPFPPSPPTNLHIE